MKNCGECPEVKIDKLHHGDVEIASCGIDGAVVPQRAETGKPVQFTRIPSNCPLKEKGNIMDNIQPTPHTKDELMHENCVLIDQLSTASDVADDYVRQIAELEQKYNESKRQVEELRGQIENLLHNRVLQNDEINRLREQIEIYKQFLIN